MTARYQTRRPGGLSKRMTPDRPRSSNGGPTGSRTLLIRIAEGDDGWPMTLHFDDGTEQWLSIPVAHEVIPAALPPSPVLVCDGGDVFAAIRQFVLDQPDESDDFEQIGSFLHRLLHRGAIGAKWDEIAAATKPRGLRLLLDLPEPFASLPWELMCRGISWPATDVASPLVRAGAGFPGALQRTAVRWPLKVLVVVGSEDGDPRVSAGAELLNLDHAFRRMCGLVDIEILERPTRAEVRDRYAELRPHIFHFIGHGDVEEGRGRLLLRDPAGGGDHAWTTAEIRSDLRGWQPRLAILNACRSVSIEEQDGAWRVANAFSELGVPAVIAMQADIRGDAAAAFAGELYKSLVAYEPLDVAVSRARRVITDTTGFMRRDFAVPSLTVTAPPESVLRMRFGAEDEHLPNIQLQHQNFPAFVDRARERRRLWRELDPEPDDPHHAITPAGAIAITGPPKVGKSELARWCVGACELHGGNAAYVNLARGHRLDCLATLELVAETLAGSLVHEDGNRCAFEPWSLAAGPLSVAAANGGPPPAPDALGDAFVYFLDALRDAAGERPLLLAIDGLPSLPDEDLRLVCDYLLKPIAQGKLAGVRVILTLSDGHSDRLTGGLRRWLGPPIALKTFKPEDFTYIAGQYLRYHFDVAPQEVAEKLAILPVRGEFSWPAVTGLADFVPVYGWERFHDHA